MHSHAYAHLCIRQYVYTHIVFHMYNYTWSSSWTHIHNPFDIYTGAFSSQKPLPDVQLSIAKTFNSGFFFHHPYNSLSCLLSISSPLSSKARATSQKEHDANSTMQMCSTVPYMHLTYSFLYAVMCIEYHRWRKKHPLCFSNAVLGILCGDSVSFRSGGSVLGLRVHHSVRYNYEKLIPGKPVWHFIHDVSYGYLMHSPLTVQPQMHGHITHTICEHKAFHTPTHTNLLTVPWVW